MIRFASPDVERQTKAPLPSLESIQLRRKIADELMRSGSSSAPVQHWTQGAARVAEALAGAYEAKQAEKSYGILQSDANEALMGLFPQQSLTGQPSPLPQSVTAPQPEPSTGAGRFASKGLAEALEPSLANAPAAIRNNNPGAMWPGPSSQKFGATGQQRIGGGNLIATFPDAVSGAAAQFDLLSRKYAGMPLADAITKWSGGNSSPQYIQSVSQATGIPPNAMLTPQMLQDPRIAVPLAKAMAQVEAGKPYPMADDQWSQAHQMALGGPQQAAQAPQSQPQGIQVADASQGSGLNRETLARMLANPLTRDAAEKLILAQQKSSLAGAEEFGKTGAIVQDADGKFYSVQFGANGTKKIEPLEMGGTAFTPARGVGEVNTGTGTQIIDRATGKDIRTINKDIAGEKIQEQIGEATGKKIAAAPSDMAVADTALELLDKIENDPYLDVGTGASSVGNVVWGTGGYDFQTMVDQATSGAFLSAIQQMRGMGSLSNAEGQTATAAITRMKTAQSREGFLSALSDYRKVVRRGREKAVQILQSGGAAKSPSLPDPLGLR